MKPEQLENWENRFDEEFSASDGQDFMDCVRVSSVKAFISSLLTAQKEGIRTEIEAKMPQAWVDGGALYQRRKMAEEILELPSLLQAKEDK